ncbi:MAG: hypothetical protein GKR93_06940 [Gammaproteobacteria bacterium]|nr:hypothetical protein [Gammaproteobacteria bacterium]
MSEIPDSWKIDRVPTKRERLSTIIASGILSIIFGSLSGMSVWMMFSSPDTRENENIYFLGSVLLLFIICIYILIRALRDRKRKPSALKAKITGYIVLVASAAMIPLALLKGEGANTFYMLAISLTGIPMGISIIKQGKTIEKRT